MGYKRTNYVKNDTDAFLTTQPIDNIVSLSQVEYDAIVTKDANTFYVII